uniref:Putative transmembrane protein n=1 Tax=Toxoplasma gondii COUG TaxID=1074873 RepID=A0A2G8YAH5_TOXGO|nr:putative transmembrane protein [Toxoplasma gondii COUG]
MDESEGGNGGTEAPLFQGNNGSRYPLSGQRQQAEHGDTFEAPVTDSEPGSDSGAGGNLSEHHFWAAVVLALVAALLCLLGKRAAAFADKRAEERRAEDQRRCQSARMRYVEKLEGEMEDFKKTEEFKELEKEAADRERGIQPEHRRTWQFRGTLPQNPHLAPRFRPNVNDRYQIRRGRGG